MKQLLTPITFSLSLVLSLPAYAASLNHYSDYGVVEQSDTHSSSSLSISNDPFGYSDEYTDSESNMQYLQARYYNPVMMRFTEMDTYPLLNRYSYADENPVMNDDPTGHSSQSTLGSVGGIVGDVGMGLGSLGSIGSIVAGALTGNPMAIIGGIMGLTSIGLGVGSHETNNSALRLGLGISSLVVGMSAMAVDYAVGTSTVAKSSNAAKNLMLNDDDYRLAMEEFHNLIEQMSYDDMRRAASVILESSNINEPDDPGTFNAAIEHYNTAAIHPEFDEEMKANLMRAIENRKSEIAFGIFKNALDRKYALLQSTDGSLVNQDILHVINPVVKDNPDAISQVMRTKMARIRRLSELDASSGSSDSFSSYSGSINSDIDTITTAKSVVT